MNLRLAVVLTVAALAARTVCAQTPPDSSALRKAVSVTSSPLYVAPDTNSTQVGSVRPGQDIGVESKTGEFVRLFNGVSGWMPNQGLVYLDDPNGAEVVFGAAVVLQGQAENGVAERQSAEDAARLYARVYDDFGATPRAGEAMFRSADIVWQLEMASQPRRRDPADTQFPDDGPLKKVESKYPNTPWAASAAFDLLSEHFTCGELTDKPDCIGKEIEVYKDYLKKYPTGPQSAQAAYNALFDAAVGATVYSGTVHPDANKARDYKAKVAADAETMRRQFPGSDLAAKAALIAYKVEQGTPVYPPTGGGKP